jgi:hypothetical protein
MGDCQLEMAFDSRGNETTPEGVGKNTGINKKAASGVFKDISNKK